MELSQSLKTSQQVALSPRLYESLKILRLGAHELGELVKQELNENPALEMPEPSELDIDLELDRTAVIEAAGPDLWRDLSSASRTVGRRDPLRAGAPDVGELATTRVSLYDHLTLQLRLLRFPRQKRRAALAVIGSLDDDGYLREPVTEIAATLGRPPAEIEAALELVQGFDPPGIAARSLRECLALQLARLNAGPLALEIAREHLSRVARDDLAGIARDLGAPVPRVKRAIKLIRSLNPRPGSLFDSGTAAAVAVPDVYVKHERGRISILPNREIQPPLHISRLYRQLAEDAEQAPGTTDEETIRFIRTKIREASRLIRDIDQRRATVTRVARAIAAAQPEFFQKGPEHLRPLGLDDIAGRLDVHASTISRAILDKYMSTPHGIFEFRYFFSSGYQACGEGGIAATAVRKRLQKMIEEEDKRHPLSDQELTGLLRKEGVPIARRTVAKYREEMGIASSRVRRKEA
ncbi:MAG: RNA polymerase factor sigma-54 [Thermoleophilia bacterium]|nr:RNA polymerase factor sigma-54 [Thermoleophilia bacterium]